MSQDKTSPKITVIIPCYNAGLFLKQAIFSVLCQPMKELELIIINDGSSDNTDDICQEIASNDSRVQYFSVPNNGAGAARNIGISNAKGTWILFLDADDLFLQDSINNVLVKKLDEYHERNIDVILTSSCESDLLLKKTITFYKTDRNYCHIPSKEFWTGIYRREYLFENNIRFFEYKQQDIESAFRYRVVSKTNRIVFDDSICFYLQRINPLSNTHTWDLATLHYVKANVYRILFDETQNLKDREWLYDVVLNEICSFYKNGLISGCNKSEYWESVNALFKQFLLKEVFGENSSPSVRNILKCAFYYFTGNISRHFKRYNDNHKKAKKVSVLDDDCFDRLSIISEYVSKCILDNSEQ